MIQAGDWLRSKEPRDMGRSVKVLGVYRPDQEPGLQKAFAVVLSRGRVSVFSLDRITDPGRFEKARTGEQPERPWEQSVCARVQA